MKLDAFNFTANLNKDEKNFLEVHLKPVSVMYEELANILGTSRVVISRSLKDLENRGKLKLSRGSIEIM